MTGIEGPLLKRKRHGNRLAKTSPCGYLVFSHLFCLPTVANEHQEKLSCGVVSHLLVASVTSFKISIDRWDNYHDFHSVISLVDDDSIFRQVGHGLFEVMVSGAKDSKPSRIAGLHDGPLGTKRRGLPYNIEEVLRLSSQGHKQVQMYQGIVRPPCGPCGKLTAICLNRLMASSSTTVLASCSVGRFRQFGSSP